MEDIQAALQGTFHMEARSLMLVTQTQRKEWASSLLERKLSVVPPIVRRLESGVALPPTVNFPVLPFSVHLPRSQEATYHQGRKSDIPIMTPWYLLAHLASPWRAGRRSDVMAKVYGSRQYQSVKRVGIPILRKAATDSSFWRVRRWGYRFRQGLSGFYSPQFYEI